MNMLNVKVVMVICTFQLVAASVVPQILLMTFSQIATVPKAHKIYTKLISNVNRTN